jgi:phosphoglycolate phosphatase-like HAD superfamily hydrolase
LFDLTKFSTIFWDFDGVIKESLDIKTQAYVELFDQFGYEVGNRVREHHRANGGMSRYQKIPIYLNYAGINSTVETVKSFCLQFSTAVTKQVIDAPWVEGVESYLRMNNSKQMFVIVSATPTDELESIVKALAIRDCFADVYGAPISKHEAITTFIQDRKLEPSNCLMIGDALADLNAARLSGTHFLLRKHADNTDLFSSYTGDTINNFKTHGSQTENH